MARVEPLDLDSATPEAREAFDRGIQQYGRMTNMKVTLLRSLPAYEALMTWYPLRDHLLGFISPRAFDLFAHAISHATKCPVCTNYFRRVLIEAGENPSAPTLDDREQALVNFGRSIGFDPRHVADEVYEPLTRYFTQDQIVALVGFAGMMVATNIVNNALRVEVDEYLQPYAEVR
ncbi:carboxymuconolactone decarboxylase family protein [Fimbriimonas ginsengisoli]|uniref:Putative transmembrane protein n=1 Tax=Fimbriimonas ginsengisoli Gsoil 348 TaxID=661478 RepID=A0A068NR61_FIMGI|nr:carboxymuconolactone decarboxylase family protein [Fimbriimonas ginsengisoli]AIE85931.1 putative transmembrane protein [Fimbriimonas ginsengisoli Gsoil 348]